MSPIRYRKTVTLAAKKLEVDEEILLDVISYYYKTLNKKIGTLQHHTFNVPNLGNFKIKPKKLEDKLLHYQRALAKFEAEIENDEDVSMRKYESILIIKEDIAGFERLITMLNAERTRRFQKDKEKVIFKIEEDESIKNMESTK